MTMSITDKQQKVKLDISRIKERLSITDVARRYTGQEPNREGKICCPFHEDGTASLQLYESEGRFHCFGCGRGGTVIDFAAYQYGLDPEDALEAAQHLDADFALHLAEEKLEPLTLEAYAAAKHLDADFLQKTFCCKTGKWKGVSYLRMPYKDSGGKATCTRVRYGGKQFQVWKANGQKQLRLYGEWLFRADAGPVALVEGESDTQTLQYLGFPALGVPGATTPKPEWFGILSDVPGIYIHKEPDSGGETFVSKMQAALQKSRYGGKVYIWSCRSVDGKAKDPSDLLIAYGAEQATTLVADALGKAKPLDIPAREVLPGLPCLPDGTLAPNIPDGYTVDSTGIYRETSDGKQLLSATPMLIVRRLKDIDGSDVMRKEICFCYDGTWRTLTADADQIATATKIVSPLSNAGCVVSSNTAKDLVAYFTAQEGENLQTIPETLSVKHFGWVGTGHTMFAPYFCDGVRIDVREGQDIAMGLAETAGSLDAWKDRFLPYMSNPLFATVMGAAFAAPLLSLTGNRGFFLYLWADSRSGKTAALYAAASAYGNPGHLVHMLFSTVVANEQDAGLSGNVPLFLDERQSAGAGGQQQKELEKLIYILSQGTGKNRGAKQGGTVKPLRWQLTAIGTGEEPITQRTTMDGTSSRLIELSGKPCTCEREAAAVYQYAGENHGHAGREFVRRLIDSVKEHGAESIRDRYKTILQDVEKAGESLNGSQLSNIANIVFALYLFWQWIGGETAETARAKAFDILPAVLPQAAKQNRQVNRDALEAILEWTGSHGKNFGSFGMNGSMQLVYSGNGPCYGFVGQEGSRHLAYLYRGELEQMLTDAGYAPGKTLAYLKRERLLLQDEKTGKYSFRKWYEGKAQRFLLLDMDAASTKLDA